ncbi:MAG TPA: tail fiber domain-containing protein, partial [Blastocatellia bacterium]|nr:tail fiber domain-containing protein [Blastocatellia bacterium]
YSMRSISAATADNAAQLGGVAANQFVLTTDTRLGDARTPTAGSSNYIQNGTAQQSGSNFNISGNGTAAGTLSGNIVNAAKQYNLESSTFLIGDSGTHNVYLGFGTGTNFGFDNTFLGSTSGGSNTGADNVFLGQAAGAVNTSGNQSAYVGQGSAISNTTGSNNAFLGFESGFANTTGNNNTFVGNQAGFSNTTGSSNTFIGNSAGPPSGTGNLTQSTAIGANAHVTTSNTIVLGTSTEKTTIPGTLAVTGLSSFTTLGAAGSTTLCRNASNQLATCSSSLRYKTNLAPYHRGLELIDKLRPISFTWKDGGMRDLGFGAEDVAKIEPLLVTYNLRGQVEGLKYDRITAVLVNAVKEQQDQISKQKQQIESLTKLVCADHPGAEICKRD